MNWQFGSCIHPLLVYFYTVLGSFKVSSVCGKPTKQNKTKLINRWTRSLKYYWQSASLLVKINLIFVGNFGMILSNATFCSFFHTTHGKLFASRNIVGEHELITVFSWKSEVTNFIATYLYKIVFIMLW